jgi:hypothetical protein
MATPTTTTTNEDDIQAFLQSRKLLRRKQLERILKNPDLCFLFREYLQAESSSENLSFWMAAETFKNAVSQEDLPTFAKKLYELYIRAGAPAEVNIDIADKKSIKEKLEAPTRDMFNDAQEVVYSLMELNFLNKFLESPKYKTCKDGQSKLPFLLPLRHILPQLPVMHYIRKLLFSFLLFLLTPHPPYSFHSSPSLLTHSSLLTHLTHSSLTPHSSLTSLTPYSSLTSLTPHSLLTHPSPHSASLRQKKACGDATSSLRINREHRKVSGKRVLVL